MPYKSFYPWDKYNRHGVGGFLVNNKANETLESLYNSWEKFATTINKVPATGLLIAVVVDDAGRSNNDGLYAFDLKDKTWKLLMQGSY